MNDVKVQYLRQRIGELVSAYESRIGDLYTELEALKGEVARMRANEEERNAQLVQEDTSEANPVQD